MICIDSDCIIDFLKGKKEAIEIIALNKKDIVSTEINKFEVFVGIYISNKINKIEEEIAGSFFSSIIILNADGWGEKGAKVFSDLMKNGKTIEQNDCLIASIMITNGCYKIITRNKKHFSRIEGIEVIDY